LHHRIPIVKTHPVQGIVTCDASVVDQDLDRATELLDNLLDSGNTLIKNSDIKLED
jgi:hypothetical protein